MEIVINGLTRDDIEIAMRTAIKAISKNKISAKIDTISAGNYGGKLGQHKFYLKRILK